MPLIIYIINKLKDILPAVRQGLAIYAESLLDVFRKKNFTDNELAGLVNQIRELEAVQAFANGKVGNADQTIKEGFSNLTRGEFFERSKICLLIYYDLGTLERTFTRKVKHSIDGDMKEHAQKVLLLIKECRNKINQDDLVDSWAEGPIQVMDAKSLIDEYVMIADAIHDFLLNYFSLDQTSVNANSSKIAV